MALVGQQLTTVRVVRAGEIVDICRACRAFEDSPIDLAASIKRGNVRLYLLERDGRAQAYVVAQLVGKRAQFGLFSREKDASGSLLSDARRLWEFAREDLAAIGITEAALWIDQDHPRRVKLMSLYERLGFGQTGISMGRGIRSY